MFKIITKKCAVAIIYFTEYSLKYDIKFLYTDIRLHYKYNLY